MSRYLKNNSMRDKLMEVLHPVKSVNVLNVIAPVPTVPPESASQLRSVPPFQKAPMLAPPPAEVKVTQDTPPVKKATASSDYNGNVLKQIFYYIKYNPNCLATDAARDLGLEPLRVSSGCCHLTNAGLVKGTKTFMPAVNASMRMINRYVALVTEYVNGAPYDTTVKSTKEMVETVMNFIPVVEAPPVQPSHMSSVYSSVIDTATQYPGVTLTEISKRCDLLSNTVSPACTHLVRQGKLTAAKAPRFVGNRVQNVNLYALPGVQIPLHLFQLGAHAITPVQTQFSATPLEAFVNAVKDVPVTCTPTVVDVPRVVTSTRQIFDMIALNRGITCAELSKELGILNKTVSARCSDMLRVKWIGVLTSDALDSEKQPRPNNRYYALVDELPEQTIASAIRELNNPPSLKETPVNKPTAPVISPVTPTTVPVTAAPVAAEDDIHVRMTALVEDLRVKEMKVLYAILKDMLKA